MNLNQFRTEYSGERIFLIGNGPSLADTPLHLLNNEYTFAVNNINEIYSSTEWRPTFYLYHADGGLIPQVKQNSELGIECFIDNRHEPHLPDKDNIHSLNVIDLLGEGNDIDNLAVDEVGSSEIGLLNQYWSTNICEKIYGYHSMYIMYQIAMYMGFERIYLIGCDLGYKKNTPHMIFDAEIDPLDYGDPETRFGAELNYIRDCYRKKSFLKPGINGLAYTLLRSRLPSSILPGLKGDENHFDPNYSKEPANIGSTNMEIRKSHMIAKRIAAENGSEIYNATLGGQLEMFDRVNVSDVTENRENQDA